MKIYEKLILTPYTFEIEGSVLDASVTPESIDPDVSVDPYGNGFGPDPFKDISFD